MWACSRMLLERLELKRFVLKLKALGSDGKALNFGHLVGGELR